MSTKRLLVFVLAFVGVTVFALGTPTHDIKITLTGLAVKGLAIFILATALFGIDKRKDATTLALFLIGGATAIIFWWKVTPGVW